MSISEEEIHSIISKEAWDAMMAAEFDDEKGFDASHQIIAYAVCAWTLGFDGEFFLNQEKALELIAPPLSDLEYRRKVKRLISRGILQESQKLTFINPVIEQWQLREASHESCSI